MDEEQHYEAFNVDNDYEGVVEIGGEFMFRCAAAVAGVTVLELLVPLSV
jgi:hypothetical protein